MIVLPAGVQMGVQAELLPLVTSKPWPSGGVCDMLAAPGLCPGAVPCAVP